MIAAIHPLTPGSPAYAIAKVSAVGGLIALRVVLSRRGRSKDDTDSSPEPGSEPTVRQPHPVSRRKAQRRRRRR
jgi:hypothetical protein